jgi:hypothetical protein
MENGNPVFGKMANLAVHGKTAFGRRVILMENGNPVLRSRQSIIGYKK